MDGRNQWWERFKEQVASTRKFVSDARAEGQLEALDAFQDVLDGIRGEFLEETQQFRRANRAARTGQAVRRTHPSLRPVAEAIARCLSRVALELEWQAAGLRARLREG
jgi:hypothetical protein